VFAANPSKPHLHSRQLFRGAIKFTWMRHNQNAKLRPY
jgi:hypothetical protein